MNWKAILVGTALALLACQSADTLRPTVLIISPHSGDTLARGLIAVTVWATDNRGVARVEFRVDSLLRDSSTSAVADTYRFNWNAASESVGSRHILEVKAFDRTGNSVRDTTSVVIGPGTGPTHHAGMIRQSETWDPLGNPHIVDFEVCPVESAVLTIKPGCIVEFKRGAQLLCGFPGWKGGTIVATGKPDSTIVFTSNAEVPAPGDWGTVGIFEQARGTSRFSYCTFEYGGRDGVGWGEFMAKSPVQVDHCVFRKCADYAVVVLPELVSSFLAANTLAENVRDGIRVAEGTIAGSVTWKDLGIPYVLDGLAVADSGTLTIKPGCTIKFTPGAGLYGSLIAVGTPENRIIFTSASETPAPGDWGGIDLEWPSAQGSRLSYCTVEYGGAGWAELYVDGTGAVIDHSIIWHSADNGVDYRAHSGLENFTENTVTACAGYPIAADPNAVGALSLGNTLTGNAHDAILINQSRLGQSTTWANLGLPYVVDNWLDVEGCLTIAPGVILQMTRQTTFEVHGRDSAALIADGTEGQITFTSDQAIPAPGDWGGIAVYAGSARGSVLRNCKIEYAGYWADANITLSDSLSTLVNDSIGYSSGYGIYLDGPTCPDTFALRLNNTFYNNARGDIYRP
jgi:large repetitive protein